MRPRSHSTFLTFCLIWLAFIIGFVLGYNYNRNDYQQRDNACEASVKKWEREAREWQSSSEHWKARNEEFGRLWDSVWKELAK